MMSGGILSLNDMSYRAKSGMLSLDGPNLKQKSVSHGVRVAVLSVPTSQSRRASMLSVIHRFSIHRYSRLPAQFTHTPGVYAASYTPVYPLREKLSLYIQISRNLSEENWVPDVLGKSACCFWILDVDRMYVAHWLHPEGRHPAEKLAAEPSSLHLALSFEVNIIFSSVVAVDVGRSVDALPPRKSDGMLETTEPKLSVLEVNYP
jgi:hypothetical protein